MISTTANVLKTIFGGSLAFLALSCSLYVEAKTSDVQPVLYGKGNFECDEELPTLSVAADNIIHTKAEWDEFVENNNFFIVAAADSKCAACCDSEPLLQKLENAIKDKALFSYPEKNKKQKKIVRKEIKLARIDLANKQLTEKLAAKGIWFPMGTTINIVKDGHHLKYDGSFGDFNVLAHHMQRVATPTIKLDSEEQILSFLDNSESTIWKEDYKNGLLAKGMSFDEDKNMDQMAQMMGVNTRVVAFFYDKQEYAEEIKILKNMSLFMANRYNLRVGLVTDERLVTKMKKSHADLFNDVGKSVMVLKRYDGAIFKLDVADQAPGKYLWWITSKSTKPVDQLTAAAFQMTEAARMPMINLFVDFKDPIVAEKSAALIKLMEEIQPEFETNFKFYWTDDIAQMQQRRLLGITWDELPSFGVNSLEHVSFAYPKEKPFERERITKWLTQVTLKKSQKDDELVAKDFSKRVRDPTIYDNFLEKTISADRDTFNDEILFEDADSVMFIYSTENVNYVQRKAAHQFNMVAEMLSKDSSLSGKIKFYSYDAYQHSFPKGITYLGSPPQDTTGTLVASEEQRKAGLPVVYIFPAGHKSLPYTRMRKFPYAQDIVDFIIQNSNKNLKLKIEDFSGLGLRSVDEQAFHRRIDREGVIQLERNYDEL